MELIPVRKSLMIQYSDFVANLAFFGNFRFMEKLDLANFT